LLVGLALVSGAPWPRSWAAIGHLAVAGGLLHGVYLGGVFASISLGVPAGVSALIVGIQPLLTAAAAGPLLGERVSAQQWIGLLLGLIGVALVVWEKLGQHLGTPFGMALSGLALLGITAGTLYQKRFCGGMDLRTGNVVQFVAAAALMAVSAALFETMQVQWTGEFVFALGWLCLVLSIGAISLLYLLIRRGAASRVASLFYMVPPVTALMAYPLFGETLNAAALAGMVLVVIGVALVNAGR
jgi:drug/metabolite transporter (DMT)-like permease